MYGQHGANRVRCNHPSLRLLAEQYTSPNVAFVALSIDDNAGPGKIKPVKNLWGLLQLHLNDKNFFGQAYGIEYIPRYILLGTDGKIINAQMPEPSNHFLRKY